MTVAVAAVDAEGLDPPRASLRSGVSCSSWATSDEAAIFSTRVLLSFTPRGSRDALKRRAPSEMPVSLMW